jgi:hypothetical protein
MHRIRSEGKKSIKELKQNEVFVCNRHEEEKIKEKRDWARLLYAGSLDRVRDRMSSSQSHISLCIYCTCPTNQIN